MCVDVERWSSEIVKRNEREDEEWVDDVEWTPSRDSGIVIEMLQFS